MDHGLVVGLERQYEQPRSPRVETATTSTNAKRPGFQSSPKAYTMLSEFGGSALSSSCAAGRGQAAASSLSRKGSDFLTKIQAALGATQ